MMYTYNERKEVVRMTKTIKKDGSVKYEGAHRTIITGSELTIDTPDYVVWESTHELYPFIFTSDSDWTVNVCAYMPSGYQIVGDSCAQVFVAGQTKALEFRVVETGSPEPNLKATIKASHKGKTQTLNVDVPGKRLAKGKCNFFCRLVNLLTGK